MRAAARGEHAAKLLSGPLRELGFEIGRLKTGTPPRLNGRTIDFNVCEEQPGDQPPVPFSLALHGKDHPAAAALLDHLYEREDPPGHPR